MSLEHKNDFHATTLPDEKPDTYIGEVQDLSYNVKAEEKVLRKFDKFLLPPLAIILLVAYLDRSNLGNAKVFGFEDGRSISNKIHTSTSPNRTTQVSAWLETSTIRFRLCSTRSTFYLRCLGLWQSNDLAPIVFWVSP